MICNFTNSVQISLIQTLKLIPFSWTIRWCWWQNVSMISGKNIFWLGAGFKCAVICRYLYQHRWMGGPDANTDRLKQSISAVRASGGFPGNAKWPPFCGLYLEIHFLNDVYYILIWLYFRFQNFSQTCSPKSNKEKKDGIVSWFIGAYLSHPASTTKLFDPAREIWLQGA